MCICYVSGNVLEEWGVKKKITGQFSLKFRLGHLYTYTLLILILILSKK